MDLWLLFMIYALMALSFGLGLWIAEVVHREAREELAGAVAQYGTHEPGCDVWESYGDNCDCGFDLAYERALEVLK